MDRQDIIARLRENEATLRARGILHAALFGSHARGEARAGSDTDILVGLDPMVRLSVVDYAGLKLCVADLFDGDVDVVNGAALKTQRRRGIESDAIFAF